MRPDALSRNPKPAVIETINDKRVFEDGVHKVELYRFADPHAGEMIVAYLPKEKLLLEADMLDLPEAGTPPAGDDTVDLANQIEKLGLQVETLIPVHGKNRNDDGSARSNCAPDFEKVSAARTKLSL